MSNIKKRPYEISLWEDVNVFSVSNGEKTVEYNGKLPGTGQMDKDFNEGQINENTFVERSKKEIFQYYSERKLCVIGSNSMNTPIQVFGANLVENTNGTSTLTFSLYYKYLDDDNDLVDNPFISLLVNERKVKLRLGAIDDPDMKWYDFVIKNIQENSENYTFTYTAKNIYINELSKTGFNLEFDTELENNQGTISELAARVLEESDWKLASNQDVIKQYREEPLYEVVIKEGVTLKPEDMEGKKTLSEKDLPGAGSKIYCFYSLIEDQAAYLQFLYSPDGYTTDENRVITNSPNWFIEDVSYSGTSEYGVPIPSFAKSIVISNDYRGKRLVRQQASVYDTTLGQYVYKYTKDGKPYYGYTKSKYISPSVVMNYIVNPSDFVDDTGWIAPGDAVAQPTSDPLWQDYDPVEGGTIISILHTELGPNKYLYNSCLYDNRSGLNDFTIGEEYVIRVKLHKKVNGENTNPAPTGLKVRIAPYERESDNLMGEGADYFETFSGWKADGSTGYFYARAQCTQSLSYVDLYNKKAGMFFTASSDASYDFIDVQFFPYLTYTKNVKDEETGLETSTEVMCVPGGDIEAEIQTQYFYYEAGQETADPEAIVYSYKSFTDSDEYIADYNTGFEKVRSITAKESNRFNILQDLCETFECWADFIIDHNSTGKILLEDLYEDGKLVGRRQRKYVRFREYIGQDNYVGFRYGKNLKSIQRTLDSESIATKLVVKQNSNEFAENGFCTIARSLENPTRDNFIYNFTYYVNQGMIDFDIVNNDLYLDANGYLGYYKKLRRLNVERDELVDVQAALLTDVATYDAQVQTWGTAVENATLQLEEKKDEVKNYIGIDYDEAYALYKSGGHVGTDNWETNQEFQNIMASVMRLMTSRETYKAMYAAAQKNLENANKQYKKNANRLNAIIDKKLALNQKFYNKYSRYIQEGSWISEDYLDDDLYFIDAESTLYNSAFPSVSYTINVLEVSQLEGFENYKFKIGDKTYIEDTEFFGWNANGRPYQEEVVVNEITTYLDEPDKNVIKVQNYKSSFADLFQRITATTNSVQYSSGAYGRAASIVETDGSISSYTMQMSLANNSYIISNAKDQSVIWDETGITTTSPSDPSNLVRIVNGGVFLSSDGGASWTTGITGNGINANYLTTGAVDTSKVIIRNNNVTSFRWDTYGLTAYQFGYGEDNTLVGYGNGTFVRYDQFGLYGIKNHDSEFVAKTEKDVWENASFALTWKGFKLQSDGVDGYVSITSDKDIQVIAKETPRITIGRIDSYTEYIENEGTFTRYTYGIRIANADGVPVMETKDDGTLWLDNILYIGGSAQSTSDATVKIGYLDETREKDENGNSIEGGTHEVFHAGTDADKSFIIYEDGRMEATGAEFHGTIYADGGKIGNMLISDFSEVAEKVKTVRVISNNGNNFTYSLAVIAPQQLTLTADLTGFKASSYKWEISSDIAQGWNELPHEIGFNAFSQSYILDASKLESYGIKEFKTYYIRVICTEEISEKEFSNYIEISYKREEPSLYIESSAGDFLVNGVGETTLTAYLKLNGIDADPDGELYDYTWGKKNDEKFSATGKSLNIQANTITGSQVYTCTVTTK